MTRRLWFIVESGTDVRLVEGLAGRWPLTLLAWRITGGREISQPTPVAYEHRTGPGFSWTKRVMLRRNSRPPPRLAITAESVSEPAS